MNDFRGDTSLHERIQCDLYYIENWSLWFDLRIIALTAYRISEPQNALSGNILCMAELLHSLRCRGDDAAERQRIELSQDVARRFGPATMRCVVR